MTLSSKIVALVLMRFCRLLSCKVHLVSAAAGVGWVGKFSQISLTSTAIMPNKEFRAGREPATPAVL